MSEPDIYTIKLTGYPADHYVLWRDYEKLKDYHNNYVVGLLEHMANCKATADRLKAEVERLRKAGDAMAKVIDDDYLNTLQVWIDWNAAKEGKPSA